MSANSTPRRVPPPCWTKHETLALIKAYRDKWFSVNRGNLRASDWDAVATSVAESSTSDPPKSSLQCRHKIEKLRKRYRMEKKRCLDFPGRFSSSWDLFPLLDAMSIGSSSSSSSASKRDRFVRDNCVDDPRINEERYLDHPDGLDQDLGFRARKLNRIVDDDYTDNGFCVKNSACDVNSVSVAFRPNSFTRGIDGKYKADDFDLRRNYSKNVENSQSQMPELKGYGKIVNGDSSVDGYGGFASKPFGNSSNGVKKAADPIAELVSAVKLSVESFVKVEKMKMEMAMEIEKKRMKTMLKHQQMIIDSQRQIVDALMKPALEAKRKRKRKKTKEKDAFVSSHCQDKSGETQVEATVCESIGKIGNDKEER